MIVPAVLLESTAPSILQLRLIALLVLMAAELDSRPRTIALRVPLRITVPVAQSTLLIVQLVLTAVEMDFRLRTTARLVLSETTALLPHSVPPIALRQSTKTFWAPLLPPSVWTAPLPNTAPWRPRFRPSAQPTHFLLDPWRSVQTAPLTPRAPLTCQSAPAMLEIMRL